MQKKNSKERSTHLCKLNYLFFCISPSFSLGYAVLMVLIEIKMFPPVMSHLNITTAVNAAAYIYRHTFYNLLFGKCPEKENINLDEDNCSALLVV